MRHFIATTVVTGIQDLGRTDLFNLPGRHIRNFEYSPFLTENHYGNLIQISREKADAKYIKNLNAVIRSNMHFHVAVESHQFVRNLLARNKIEYTNLTIQPTEEMYEICKERKMPIALCSDPNKDPKEEFFTKTNQLINDSNAYETVLITPENIDVWDGFLLMY